MSCPDSSAGTKTAFRILFDSQNSLNSIVVTNSFMRRGMKMSSGLVTPAGMATRFHRSMVTRLVGNRRVGQRVGSRLPAPPTGGGPSLLPLLLSLHHPLAHLPRLQRPP